MKRVARIIWQDGKSWKWFAKRELPDMWQELADLKAVGFADARVEWVAS
jgi:hypothetical protein